MANVYNVTPPSVTMAVGQVSVPHATATKILSTNANRKHAQLESTHSTTFYGVDSSVTNSNGFQTPSNAVVLSLTTTGEVWAYETDAGGSTVSYLEESYS